MKGVPTDERLLQTAALASQRELVAGEVAVRLRRRAAAERAMLEPLVEAAGVALDASLEAGEAPPRRQAEAYLRLLERQRQARQAGVLLWGLNE